MAQIKSPQVLRVQVVDDCAVTARSMRDLLNSWGHEVAIALSGEEGLGNAITFRPDIILLDIQMPQMHGGEVAHRLREIPGFNEVVIIAVTALSLDDPLLDHFRENFNAYLQKPLSPDRLETLLQSVAIADE